MKTLPKINDVRVLLSELAADVHAYGQYLKANFSRADLRDSEDDTAGGEMRLQVKESGWQTHHGDSQFDQDHRGMWSNAFVPYGCTQKEAREIARDLIEQCE